MELLNGVAMLSFQEQQVKSSTQKAEAKSGYVRIMGPLPTSPFPGAKPPPRMLKNCNLTIWEQWNKVPEDPTKS
ncbi:hypothetical protein PAL_GLEAN10024221 [Pteropus alecto]|uniref:Uncharacterized protein n=1 Tax=Pteropus alecto TaxID=9402 RepID=L5JXN4_PTEAL|nr:hypothetical protein PAL_GLEAN10024221 [Pteropus alecto]